MTREEKLLLQLCSTLGEYVRLANFDKEIFDPGRGSVRVDRAYDAPISSVSFNWNSINVYIKPTVPGKPAEVFLDPEGSPVEFLNQSKTVSGSKKSLAVERTTKSGRDTITVSGEIGIENKDLTFILAKMIYLGQDFFILTM